MADEEEEWASAEVDGVPSLPATPTAQQPTGQPPRIDPSVFKDWICIYPCYLNPKKKTCEGRKLPLHLLVGCDDPWPQDIFESLVRIGFNKDPAKRPLLLQPKMHPRDWPNRARVRVTLKDEAGAFVVPGIESKDALLRAIARVLPESPFRQQRLVQMARQMEMQRAQAAAAAAAAAKQPAAKALRDAVGSAPAAGAAAKKDDKKAKKKK